jgi:hypothetical protein
MEGPPVIMMYCLATFIFSRSSCEDGSFEPAPDASFLDSGAREEKLLERQGCNGIIRKGEIKGNFGNS